MSGHQDLSEVLRTLRVSCDHIRYGFATLPDAAIPQPDQVLGTFREAEGWTIIASEDYFEREGLPYQGPFARLTVEVHTSLQLVGLTAVLAAALADWGIPANVVAAYFHDHIFVPYDLRERAIQAIRERKQVQNHL
jgi:hypothetical protein